MYKLLPILLFGYGLALTTDDIYDNSYALIIGIDKYENVSNLDYAVKDANTIASLLKDNFNFPSKNVTVLLNEEATFTNIRNGLSKVSSSAKANDRVLIYFAGHGETMDLPDGGEMGYLLPIDGKRDNLFATSILMDDLKKISSMTKAKHMLFLIDACYGGLATTGARGLSSTTPNFIDKITNDKSRQIITAGGRGEEVIEKSEWGHSAFTMNLIRALDNGKADLNDDGYITGDELGLFLKEKVTIDSDNQQTPQSRRFTSHEGEFVFINNVFIEKQIINISTDSEKENVDDLYIHSLLTDSTVHDLKKEIELLKSELNKPVKFIQGCTDDRAANYNPDANIDDNSCVILGANDVYIRFGDLDNRLLTLDIFIKTGIGSGKIESINFNTEGFIIKEITDGIFNNKESVILLENSVISNITSFNANYEEELLLRARIHPLDDTFCIEEIKVFGAQSTDIDQIYVDDCLQNLSLPQINSRKSLKFDRVNYIDSTLNLKLSLDGFTIESPAIYEPTFKFVFFENDEWDDDLEIEYRISEIGLEGLWLAILGMHIDQELLNAKEIGYVNFDLRDEDLKIKVNVINFKGTKICIDKAELITYDQSGNPMFQYNFMINQIECFQIK